MSAANRSARARRLVSIGGAPSKGRPILCAFGLIRASIHPPDVRRGRYSARLSAEREVTVKLIGVLLIVFGVVALAVGGISYTKREKVLDIGPVQATTEEHKTIPIP